MRWLSEASAMVAPPVQDFDGVFRTMVVSEASTSPAAFSRTVPSPPKQRTKTRPPSAPSTSQCAGANSFAFVVSTTKAKPLWASSGSPRPVGAIPSSPLKASPARVVCAVVEVATAARPSTPTSVALCRKAAARTLGAAASARTSRDCGARSRLRTALPQRVTPGVYWMRTL
jgi:hypothetical protein